MIGRFLARILDRLRWSSGEGKAFAQLVAEIRRCAVFPIEGVLQGPAVIEGRALLREPLVAPITGIAVIGFRVKVEARMFDRRRTIVDWSQVNDFAVEDGTGRALVETRGCQMMLNLEYQGDSVGTGLIPPTVLALLNRHARIDWGSQTPDNLWWSEHYLEAGEDVFVYGHARRELDPDQRSAVGYRQAPTRVVMQKPEGGMLFFADMKRDEFLKRVKDTW